MLHLNRKQMLGVVDSLWTHHGCQDQIKSGVVYNKRQQKGVNLIRFVEIWSKWTICSVPHNEFLPISLAPVDAVWQVSIYARWPIEMDPSIKANFICSLKLRLAQKTEGRCSQRDEPARVSYARIKMRILKNNLSLSFPRTLELT